MNRPQDRLIIALDYADVEAAMAMARLIAPQVGMLKVGLELFSSAGPAVIEAVRALGARVFYDGKLHDIPNTVAGAAAAVGRMGVALFNVHALGGKEMMKAAKEGSARAAEEAGWPPPLVVGVTILTSLDERALRGELGIAEAMPQMVARLARLAQEAGLDGVVCSAAEIGNVKQACGDRFLTVVPGIRPGPGEVAQRGLAADDQARVATPRAALEAGADYLVVGRPVTRARDPQAAIAAIIREMAGSPGGTTRAEEG